VQWSYSCAFGASLALLGAIAVLGQDIPRRGSMQPDADGPCPRLPGAVANAPDWIGTDAPFDVARFFASVPRDRNAAPPYLDALFEFGSNVAVCFPEGPERDRRSQAAEDRIRRYVELQGALRNHPEGVPPEAIDAVIALHETGFRKLALAQRRDRCVFETSLGPEEILCHVQASRQVVRIAMLRTWRAVDGGDYDAAIRDVEVVLRLVRDLRPRGFMFTQLVAAAITQVVCVEMIKPILAGPRLRVEHCDRLLKVLLDHEASSVDSFAEGLRAEYLFARIKLREFARKQPQGTPQAAPDDPARAVRDTNDYYRTLLGLDGVPYAKRLEKIATLKIPQGDDTYSQVVRTIRDAVELASFTQQIGRMNASLHASECMIVMRRWQLKHRGLPRALAVPVKDAGLKAIPTDPYDGQPMRVALLGSPPVVYSVGKDGRDDGGQKDSNYDTQPGDLLYRMPPVQDWR